MSLVINPQGEAAITLPDPQQVQQGELGRSVTFTWPHFLRERIPELRIHEAKRLNSGQPRANRSGAIEAVADPGAKICAVSWLERSTSRTVNGVYVITTADMGPSGWTEQTLSLIVFQTHTLLYRGTGERFNV